MWGDFTHVREAYKRSKYRHFSPDEFVSQLFHKVIDLIPVVQHTS
jgi:hypothetical protein